MRGCSSLFATRLIAYEEKISQKKIFFFKLFKNCFTKEARNLDCSQLAQPEAYDGSKICWVTLVFGGWYFVILKLISFYCKLTFCRDRRFVAVIITNTINPSLNSKNLGRTYVPSPMYRDLLNGEIELAYVNCFLIKADVEISR